MRGLNVGGVLGLPVMKQIKLKETKMKSSIIFRCSVLASCLALGTLGLPAPGAALAEGKGASLLMAGTTVGTAGQPQNSTSRESAMSCARCKDGLTSTLERTHKGMNAASVRTIPVHLCPACVTKIASVGSGKAKTDKATHTCGDTTSSSASCCMTAK